jgi:hypothetical protein
MNGTLDIDTINACRASGTWITLDTDRARAFLRDLTDVDGLDGALTAETIADVLAGMCNADIITSPIGAEPTLDALTGDDDSVRQLILLPGLRTIADSHSALQYFLTGSTTIDRALGAVSDIVDNTNRILADFFATFTLAERP